MANFSVRFKVKVPLVAMGCLLFGTALSSGAEFSLKPAISVREEYNDNVLLEHDKKDDFVTWIVPGFNLEYNAPLGYFRTNYELQYLHFAKGSRGDEINHNLFSLGTFRLIDNFFYLKFSESYRRIPINISQHQDATFVDQVDWNIFTISPFVRWSPVKQLMLKFGYIYRNSYYTRSDAINWQEHGAFLNADYELTDKLFFTSGLNYVHHVNEFDDSYNRLTPSIGLKYNYANNSYGYLGAGYTFLLADQGQTSSSPYWSGMINHDFGPVTAIIKGEVLYASDPTRDFSEQRSISAKLVKQIHRGDVSLGAFYNSYKDYEADEIYSEMYGMRAESSYSATSRMTVNAFAGAGKYTYSSRDGYEEYLPQRFSVGAGLSYLLANDLTLSLNYQYSTYRHSLSNSADSIDNNRVTVGLTKSFEMFGQAPGKVEEL